MQKDANLAELEKCCQTHIFLQNFVLIQPRTSPPKICKILLILNFPNFANGMHHSSASCWAASHAASRSRSFFRSAAILSCFLVARTVDANLWQKFGKISLVFGCISTDFCKKIRVLEHFSKSSKLSS